MLVEDVQGPLVQWLRQEPKDFLAAGITDVCISRASAKMPVVLVSNCSSPQKGFSCTSLIQS
jgi:hypothetical protein